MKNTINKKTLYIMRGCPASGKSYLANELAGEAGSVFSADDYHVDPKTGKYNWKPQNVSVAHKWNHKRVALAIIEGVSSIVIDNTNVKLWELKKLKPIIKLAQKNDYDVRIEEPNPNWYHWDTAFDAEALFERNKESHNVPLASIQKMIDNYHHDITIDDILAD